MSEQELNSRKEQAKLESIEDAYYKGCCRQCNIGCTKLYLSIILITVLTFIDTMI